jgi:hypothetical protein
MLQQRRFLGQHPGSVSRFSVSIQLSQPLQLGRLLGALRLARRVDSLKAEDVDATPGREDGTPSHVSVNGSMRPSI